MTIPRNDSVTYLGVRFVAAPGKEHLADVAQCTLCGMLVDVAGELRDHARQHAEDIGDE